MVLYWKWFVSVSECTVYGSDPCILNETCYGPDCDDGNQNIYPLNEEICDGLDDDCDPASVDGSEDRQNGTACDTGEQGVCAAGATNCVSGSLICAANTSPSVEICNDLDDDCDGQTDEGCDNSFVSTRRTGMKALSNVQE